MAREEHNPRRTFLGRGSWTETARIAEVLRQETVGGALLLLGTEGPGLPPAVLARMRGLRIAMASGFDSLNVATAGAIALHHLAGAGLRPRDNAHPLP